MCGFPARLFAFLFASLRLDTAHSAERERSLSSPPRPIPKLAIRRFFVRYAASTAGMQIQLEDLEYQRRAIAAVVGVLKGQIKNTFDNSNLFGMRSIRSVAVCNNASAISR